MTSPSAERRYSAYVLAKMNRLRGARGIHVGTMGFGKMEGENEDRAVAYIIERNSHTGPACHQAWFGMKPTTPIISGGMNALRLPGFFENPGHANVINTAGGGSCGPIDSPADGAKWLRQAYECWMAKTGSTVMRVPPLGRGRGEPWDGTLARSGQRRLRADNRRGIELTQGVAEVNELSDWCIAAAPYYAPQGDEVTWLVAAPAARLPEVFLGLTK